MSVAVFFAAFGSVEVPVTEPAEFTQVDSFAFPFELIDHLQTPQNVA
jgi:hypothetical protein